MFSRGFHSDVLHGCFGRQRGSQVQHVPLSQNTEEERSTGDSVECRGADTGCSALCTGVRVAPFTSMPPYTLLSLLFLAPLLLARPVLGFIPYPTTTFSPQQLLQHAQPSASSSSGTAHRCKSELGMSSPRLSPADKLRDLISRPEILIMPCCYDGLTARLVEDNGFPLTFMTGFGVSGAHGLPDTQVRETLMRRYLLPRQCMLQRFIGYCEAPR